MLSGLLVLSLAGISYGAEEAENSAFDFSKNGYEKWKSISPEASIEKKKDGETPIMVFKVKIDHEKDGKGWPRIYKYFFHPKIEISKYKEYIFEYKITTSRSDDNKEKTPFYIYFATGKTKITYTIDGGKEDGQWHSKVVKIADILARGKVTAEDFKQVNLVQFGVAEATYPDKTEITIEIKGVQLQ